MSKKPKDTNDDPGHAPEDDEVDPVQAKYEAEALAEQARLDKAAKAEGKAYSEPAEEMPQRFFTGGATADEKEAWIEAHGGPKVEGVVEPGHAEPKAEGDVAPE